MSELFDCLFTNLTVVIRIVSCVRGECSFGPVVAGSRPNEEFYVDSWTHFEFGRLFPNSDKTHNGAFNGSRMRMAVLLLHMRPWLLDACEEIWDLYASQDNTERHNTANRMQTSGYQHIVINGTVHHMLFLKEFQETWDMFVLREFPELDGILPFDEMLHNTAPTQQPNLGDDPYFRGVQTGLHDALKAACMLAYCCKPTWGVEAAERANVRDMCSAFGFFKGMCLRE